MQTFLPWAGFKDSAQSLDYRRLGKQRVETLQLLKGQWPNHPASKMWWGHFYSLGNYGIAVCEAWRAKGYKDTCLEKITVLRDKFVNTGEPDWLGDDNFHRAHRGVLYKKDSTFYASFAGWQQFDEYTWPTTGQDLMSDLKAN